MWKLMLKHGAKLEQEIVSYYDMVKLNALYHEATVKWGFRTVCKTISPDKMWRAFSYDMRQNAGGKLLFWNDIKKSADRNRRFPSCRTLSESRSCPPAVHLLKSEACDRGNFSSSTVSSKSIVPYTHYHHIFIENFVFVITFLLYKKP